LKEEQLEGSSGNVIVDLELESEMIERACKKM